MIPDRRQHPRYLVRAPLSLTIAGQQPSTAELVDISTGGCFFVGAAPVRTGSAVRLTFVTDGEVCVGAGTIVRSADRRGFAVQFDELNDAAKAFISAIGATDKDARRALVEAIARVTLEVQ